MSQEKTTLLSKIILTSLLITQLSYSNFNKSITTKIMEFASNNPKTFIALTSTAIAVPTIAITSYFINKKEDEIDSLGNTKLLLACKNNNIKKVKQLLSKSQKNIVNRANKKGNTPLYYACKNDNIEMIKCLIANGADLNQEVRNRGFSVIQCALFNNDMMKLLIDNGCDIDKGPMGRSMLMIFCVKPDDHDSAECFSDAAEYLLNFGADANKTADDGTTAIFYALSQKNSEKDFDLIELLVANGANIDKANLEGITPLILCCNEPDFEFTRYLLEFGADANKANNDGHTPFFYALQKKSIEIMDLLLTYGADINAIDESGATPLIYSLYSEKIDFHMVKCLVSNGADVNKANKYSTTPLNIACYKNNIEIVKYLIENGAKKTINIMNTNGYTPLKIAIENNNQEMIEYLISQGAIEQ
jgi:ankyrin repeat protein